VSAPFIVLALPRSRTFWLSRYLSYGDWIVGHDELMHIRTLDEIATWFTQPNIGTVETCAAPFWRLLPKDARIVTVRRPVDDVLASLAAQGIGGETVAAMIRACDRKLDQIERRIPGVLSVRFDDLALESTCAAVFEHCLQLPHDPAWWREWDARNVSGDLKRQVRYCHAFLPQLLKLARSARQRMLADMSKPAVPPDGFTIQEERIDTCFRDAVPLIREHMIATGQDVDDYKQKNEPLFRKLEAIGALQIMTARSNGRLFGYLMTLIGPSLDAENRMEALHVPFFVSKDCPGGLGMKLQRAAIERLREKGVADVFARAGVRGSGPRLGIVYRRLGFEEFGTMYRRDLSTEAA
jgi:GNAT superfamily N-acetyltransferase